MNKQRKLKKEKEKSEITLKTWAVGVITDLVVGTILLIISKWLE